LKSFIIIFDIVSFLGKKEALTWHRVHGHMGMGMVNAMYLEVVVPFVFLFVLFVWRREHVVVTLARSQTFVTLY